MDRLDKAAKAILGAMRDCQSCNGYARTVIYPCTVEIAEIIRRELDTAPDEQAPQQDIPSWRVLDELQHVKRGQVELAAQLAEVLARLPEKVEPDVTWEAKARWFLEIKPQQQHNHMGTFGREKETRGQR